MLTDEGAVKTWQGVWRNQVWAIPGPPPVQPHVWVLYHHDYGPVADVIYYTVEEAVRAQAQQGYGRVARWPLGMTLTDAVKAWEAADA